MRAQRQVWANVPFGHGKAIEAIARGKIVIVTDDGDRKN